GGGTAWVDCPLTRAVRDWAICYLDEIVEARQDTTVVLHPLADHRRQMPIDRLGQTLEAAPEFCLVVSYNPGYQSVLKDLKDSTRQRMVAIELDLPPPDIEEKIVAHEAEVDHQRAASTVGRSLRRGRAVSSYESTAEPIKLGYLFDFKLPDSYPEESRQDLVLPFELVFKQGLEQGMIDRPVHIVFREVEGLPKG